MKTEVDFYSDAFMPFLPEESQVNPECYGAELAWWLCQKLSKHGVYTSYPNFEDWGWFLEYIIDDNEYCLCCGNIAGERNHWRIFLKPLAKSFFSRKQPPDTIAQPLLTALKAVLEYTPEVSGVEWHDTL